MKEIENKNKLVNFNKTYLLLAFLFAYEAALRAVSENNIEKYSFLKENKTSLAPTF